MYLMTQAPFYFTEREARAEYARLRTIAQKRIERLEKAGLKVRGPRSSYAPLPRDASDVEIYKSLADVAKFVSMKSSTVTGRREQLKKFVETMQDRGYDFINMNNAEQFGDFMEEAQKHDEYRGYGSKDVAELFHIAKTKHVDPIDLAKDLDLWMGNEKLKTMSRSRNIIGSDELKERLGLSKLKQRRIRQHNKAERLKRENRR
jgi:hypothetical protein